MNALLAPAARIDSRDTDLDLDSVAAVVYGPDGRYLLQHREDIAGISYPGHWSLLGGSREGTESAGDAICRELLEELELHIQSPTPMIGCTYEIVFEGRRARKIFFDVAINHVQAKQIVLHEGQGYGWFDFGQVLDLGKKMVPYDLSPIALHHSLMSR